MQGNAAAGGLLVVIARKYARLFETHAVTGKGDRFVTGLRDTIAWHVSSFHAYGGRSMDGVDYKRSVRRPTSVSPIILQPKSVAT
jgi:hypothetical protein